MQSPGSGVYFLADDGVLEWTIALLESLRAYSPDVRVLCIPFSSRTVKLRRLARRFDFVMYEDASIDALEAVGFALSDGTPGRTFGTFRKLAAFWGPLTRFLYLDADVVVLDQVEPLIDLTARSGLDLLYADANLDEVYRPGPVRDEMVTEFGSHGINTGVWAARAGVLSLDQVRRVVDPARSRMHGFATTAEQPFFNLCLDLNRCRMASFTAASRGRVRWHWPGDPSPIRVETLSGAQVRVGKGEAGTVTESGAGRRV
jgi:hypothetical protein